MSELTKALRNLADFIDSLKDELKLPFEAYYLAKDIKCSVKFAKSSEKNSQEQ